MQFAIYHVHSPLRLGISCIVESLVFLVFYCYFRAGAEAGAPCPPQILELHYNSGNVLKWNHFQLVAGFWGPNEFFDEHCWERQDYQWNMEDSES